MGSRLNARRAKFLLLRSLVQPARIRYSPMTSGRIPKTQRNCLSGSNAQWNQRVILLFRPPVVC